MAIVVNPLTNAIELLQDFGFFQVVLPMILVFAVFYGILYKTKIFGDSDEVQYLNAVIAFVAAFLVVASTEIVRAINELIPHAAFLLIIVMLLLMLFAFFGIKTQGMFDEPSRWVWVVAIILFVIFLGVLDYSMGWEIPIIHGLSESFTGAEGGAGAGAAGSDYWDEAAGMIISFAILLGLPFLVIWFMVKKK